MVSREDVREIATTVLNLQDVLKYYRLVIERMINLAGPIVHGAPNTANLMKALPHACEMLNSAVAKGLWKDDVLRLVGVLAKYDPDLAYRIRERARYALQKANDLAGEWKHRKPTMDDLYKLEELGEMLNLSTIL